MKTYTVNLKGSKKNNTQDIQVFINCDSKSQCFNFAYKFFENGDTNAIYGTKETGLATIHRWMPNAESFKQFAGKYKVYRTSIQIN